MPHPRWRENYGMVQMMRSTKRNRANDRRATASSEAEQLRLVKATTISKGGDHHRQYPARVGYHGTDNEKDLSPEE